MPTLWAAEEKGDSEPVAAAYNEIITGNSEVRDPESSKKLPEDQKEEMDFSINVILYRKKRSMYVADNGRKSELPWLHVASISSVENVL